jgi:cobalt-zinc-cadmium efflux system protein
MLSCSNSPHFAKEKVWKLSGLLEKALYNKSRKKKIMKHQHRPKQTSVADELFEYRSVEKKKLKLAMGITGITMLAEIVGGLFTNSLALISDGGHMFTHFFALAVSFSAILCSGIKECKRRTFGFYRIEILAALFNSVFIFAATAWIAFEGIQRMFRPEPVMSLQMLLIALIGLIVNLISAWILHGASKEDLNIKSAFLHLWADTLSSFAIIIGAVIINFTGWDIIDPLLSIVIALIILVWGWNLFRDSVNILLEFTPKGIDSDDVAKTIKEQVPEVEEIFDLHIWEITSKMYSLTAHIRVNRDFRQEETRLILEKIKKLVDKKYDIEHTTIELV